MVTPEVATSTFRVTKFKINGLNSPQETPPRALSLCKEARVNLTSLCAIPTVSPVVEAASWLNTCCRKAVPCSHGTQRENWSLSSGSPAEREQACDNCHLAGLFHRGVRTKGKEFPVVFLMVLLHSWCWLSQCYQRYSMHDPWLLLNRIWE